LKKKSIFADARTLEDAFFTKENARLLEQLKGKQKREALREMVKVEDETFLDRLIELGIGPETVLALTLVPLIAVAWADGTLDGREAAGNVAFPPARAGVVRQLEAVRPRYLGNLHRRGASANAKKDARLGLGRG
jgi:hypothetical protein